MQTICSTSPMPTAAGTTLVGCVATPIDPAAPLPAACAPLATVPVAVAPPLNAPLAAAPLAAATDGTPPLFTPSTVIGQSGTDWSLCSCSRGRALLTVLVVVRAMSADDDGRDVATGSERWVCVAQTEGEREDTQRDEDCRGRASQPIRGCRTSALARRIARGLRGYEGVCYEQRRELPASSPLDTCSGAHGRVSSPGWHLAVCSRGALSLRARPCCDLSHHCVFPAHRRESACTRVTRPIIEMIDSDEERIVLLDCFYAAFTTFEPLHWPQHASGTNQHPSRHATAGEKAPPLVSRDLS